MGEGLKLLLSARSLSGQKVNKTINKVIIFLFLYLGNLAFQSWLPWIVANNFNQSFQICACLFLFNPTFKVILNWKFWLIQTLSFIVSELKHMLTSILPLNIFNTHQT
jgi:hypothetical protein